MAGRRKRRRTSRPKKRYRQRGGARFVRRPTLQDKIAQGASMLLSGPAPSFATLGLLLGKQAYKGVKDNVSHYLKGRK